MILSKSFYIRWSAGRSPRVHEVNPGRDSSGKMVILVKIQNFSRSRMVKRTSPLESSREI